MEKHIMKNRYTGKIKAGIFHWLMWISCVLFVLFLKLESPFVFLAMIAFLVFAALAQCDVYEQKISNIEKYLQSEYDIRRK